MLRRIVFIISFCISIHAFGQQADFKLYLVGDAGEDEMSGETLDSLKSKLLQNPKSAIVFMGDNCYKNAFFDLLPSFKGFDSSKVTQNKIQSQLDILNDYRGSAFFIPGNHDWWNITRFKKGKRKLKMEESFIEANLSKNPTIANPTTTFFPKYGSPGPATAELDNKKVRIVFIDTYWLILLGFKENPKENFAIANTFYHRLDSILALATSQHQSIIIVAHHPVYFTDKFVDKGFPMRKKVKHAHPLSRLKQSNITFPSYDTMAVKVNAILQKYPGVFYASGHIHALQFHTTKDNVNYIISGSGSKTLQIKEKWDYSDLENCGYGACELWNEKGFFEIDFYKNYTPEVVIYHESGKESTILKSPENLK